MPRYNPATVEPKWQAFWEAKNTFATPRLPVGEKLYVLDMFPYPSGDGLHVGHPEGYTATDIVCRAARMQGKTVMHPMGFDSFGLPAEEHAIKTGEHPRVQTEKNIATFRRQMKMLGFSYDWSREVATTDVEYFRWTQWIFLQIYDTWFDAKQQKGRPISELPIPQEISDAGEGAILAYQDEHRLAYQSEAPVNWCPALGTVLANEEVINGKSERGSHPVERRPLRQWMLRITAYADRLENDLETLDWSDGVKALQRNWIGRSTGAEVEFRVHREGSITENTSIEYDDDGNRVDYVKTTIEPETSIFLRVYTTRPDTLFGATYMVIAPEHTLVDQLVTSEHASAVRKYVRQAGLKSDLDRTELAKEKTGVFTGSFATNPVNGEKIPIWIADYVLISYGTGAIMAVPAHDERDFEFAKQFGIKIVPVVASRGGEDASDCFAGEGIAINSGEFNGLPTAEFKVKITEWLTEKGLGRKAVNYKLRDWLFSRQRFWGEPFPILHELDAEGNKTGVVRAVPEDQLPVDLPHLEDFKPHGRPEPPLDKAPEEWLFPTLSPEEGGDGVRYKRETNTMPQWAGSCWYYLRFLDPTNTQAPIDPELEKAWMPIDLYIGGAEHAVLHLLYARFWHKVLFDRGVVSTLEPFQKLVNQGMILGENNEKMSKSRGNVINPDTVVSEYGADALRLYEMFMGPLQQMKPWNMDGVNGVFGFLNRAWRMIVDDQSDELQLSAALSDAPPSVEQNRVLHKTIKAVTADIEKLSFNTAIARMMEFTNFFTKQKQRPRVTMEPFVLLLSPFAPHIAEELWQILGHSETLAYEPWPLYEESLLVESQLEIPVQIQGKVRTKITVPADADKAKIEEIALADKKVKQLLEGKKVVKTIVVPGRLVNFVAQHRKSP